MFLLTDLVRFTDEPGEVFVKSALRVKESIKEAAHERLPSGEKRLDIVRSARVPLIPRREALTAFRATPQSRFPVRSFL